jgi:hypothetical protein
MSSEVLSALAGALAAYVFGWWQQWRDKRRRRAAAATLLLYELRIMDVALREMWALEHPANQFAGPGARMFEALQTELLLFEASTAEAVLTAWGYLSDIRYRLEELGTGKIEREAWDDDLRWLARLGIEAVPAARAALVSEGGIPPRLDVNRTTEFPARRTPLPPSPFN